MTETNNTEPSRPALKRRSTADMVVEEDLLGAKHLGIYAWIGAVFIVAPLMPHKKGGFLARVVGQAYNRFGAAGLLGIPFVSLMMEKSLYDTWCAYHGQSIYEDAEGTDAIGKHGGFPSGGASLPSFSLLKTREETERATFRSDLLDRCWAMARGASQ
jgi:hypothetical protein